MKNALPAKLDPSNVVAVVDTREQRPLSLDPLRTEPATLATGDYSLKGLESHVCIERKSLDDLLGCVGRDRERFERELQRMLAYPVRCLLVEATWAEIEVGQWRSKVTSSQAMGSLVGWAAMGIQVCMIGDHARAGQFASRLLFTVARRRYAELRQFSQVHEQPVEPITPPLRWVPLAGGSEPCGFATPDYLTIHQNLPTQNQNYET